MEMSYASLLLNKKYKGDSVEDRVMNKGTGRNKKYIVSLIQVFFLIFCALIVPRCFLFDRCCSVCTLVPAETNFKLGVESVTQEFIDQLKARHGFAYTVGLITNHSAVDQKGRKTAHVLLSYGLPLKKVFIPEDDFAVYKKNNNSELPDDEDSFSLAMLAHTDQFTKTREFNFADIDVLFFDMQDSGISSSTASITLFKTLQSAIKHHKTVVVLDRPNFLGCAMEGILQEEGREKEDSLLLPLRHGMTSGELAYYFNNNHFNDAAALFVIPMQNYSRDLFANMHTSEQTGLLTNIDTHEATSLLPVLSTIKPFVVETTDNQWHSCLYLAETEGISKQKWFELRSILKELGIESTWHRYYNAKKKTHCAGLRFIIQDMQKFSVYNTVLTIVAFFKEAGVSLTFSPEFDQVIGGKKMRSFLEGKYARHELEYIVNKGLKTFFNRAYPSFIYKPIPKVVFL